MASTASTGPVIARPVRARFTSRGLLPSAALSARPSARLSTPPSARLWAPPSSARAAGRRSGLSAAVLSGSPEGVPAGDDASSFVSFSEQDLGSGPIMAPASNRAGHGPQGSAAHRTERAYGRSPPLPAHCTATHAQNAPN